MSKSDHLVLHGYWRSSASYRVRIALNLKQLDYDYVSVHLLQDGGQQHQPAYRQMNPAGLVPTLVIQNEEGSSALNQSLAIIEYLEEQYSATSLLPGDAAERARIRAFALDLAADLQPLINLRVQQFLTNELAVSETGKASWLQHWFKTCFTALEQRLQETAGDYCFGDRITLADVCLVPQVYSAERFAPDLSPYPKLQEVYQRLCAHPAFVKAHPSQQPDAV